MANISKAYLSAKAFSALTHVPLDTIKYYDRIGLLKPAFVGENKYRYYLPEQALDLTRIIFSVRAKIKLEDIQKIMTCNDAATSMSQYMEIYNTLEDKISELEAIRNTIVNLKYWYDLALQHPPRSLFFHYLPEWFMIYSPKLNISSGEFSNDSNLANELFFKAFYDKRWPHYQLGAYYETADLLQDNYSRVAFFIKTDHPERHTKEELCLNAQGTYLCYLDYTGGKNMAQTVRSYLQALQEQKLEIIGNIYVHDVVNSLITSDPKEYCTMIYAKAKKDIMEGGLL